MERIVKHLSCTDTQKVLCAEFMLVDDVGHWWESVSRTGLGHNNATLGTFQRGCDGKIFPTSSERSKGDRVSTT